MEPPKKKKPLNNYIKYSNYAFQMGIIIFIFMIIGHNIDNYLNNERAYFTAFFSILGVFFSILQLIKNVKSDN